MEFTTQTISSLSVCDVTRKSVAAVANLAPTMTLRGANVIEAICDSAAQSWPISSRSRFAKSVIVSNPLALECFSPHSSTTPKRLAGGSSNPLRSTATAPVQPSFNTLQALKHRMNVTSGPPTIAFGIGPAWGADFEPPVSRLVLSTRPDVDSLKSDRRNFSQTQFLDSWPRVSEILPGL